MNPKDTRVPSQGEAASTTVIEPSGKTDDIRYVLNAEPVTPTTPVISADESKASGPAPSTGATGGLADQVIDNVDSQLPDRTGSTIEGGQVGKESKRGAY